MLNAACTSDACGRGIPFETSRLGSQFSKRYRTIRPLKNATQRPRVGSARPSLKRAAEMLLLRAFTARKAWDSGSKNQSNGMAAKGAKPPT